MAPPSGVVASKMPGNSVVLSPTPKQPPSKQELKAETNEAHSFMNLAPWIIALNVALPLLSVLFLVMMLSRMDRAAPTTGKEP